MNYYRNLKQSKKKERKKKEHKKDPIKSVKTNKQNPSTVI